MIDTEIFALAQSLVQASQSPGFIDMYESVKEDCAKAEHEASNAPATLDDRSARNLLTMWQAYRKVIAAIDEQIENAVSVIKQVNEEAENDRAVERSRNSRANW